MRLTVIFLGLCGLLPVVSNSAQAHGVLDHASPRVGSTVPKSPQNVTLWFTEKLEPAFSRIEVRNASGDVVSDGKAKINRTDHTQLLVPLKSLSPGTYTVNWRILSVDTHRTQGSFKFRVGP
jgi:methionine-rich copper-binding protein CopC